MNFDEALRYLDDHTSYDVTGRIDSPTTERIGRLCAAMGDPQHAAPVIHVTGTNGKGSTVQMISRLLMASGLTVGTYTSPHLERINERIQRNGEPISDEEFAEQIAAIAQLEAITGVRPSFFEAITAAAFRWFADVAVDVMVIEVGPVPQGVLNARVVEQTRLGLETCLKVLDQARLGSVRLPAALVVHRHLGSHDLPKSDDGEPQALVHPELQGRDWQAIAPTQAMFRAADGTDQGEPWVEGEVPVFVNEAAYAEKSIAFSLTRREVWPVQPTWLPALQQLLRAA